MSTKLRTHIEKITPITDAEFAYILSHFKYKKLKKHQFLIQQGQEAHHDHFVLSGLLRAYYTNNQGKEHILQFAMENWWVTDYSAYFNNTKATTNIDCLEDCEVLCISHKNREKLCNNLQKMERFFRIKSNFGYIALQQRILSLLNQDAKGRYHAFKKQYPYLLQRIPKTILASYLGVSRETLSRIS